MPTEKYDNDMVKVGGFLYKITVQGYQEKNGISFGYFRNLKLLQKVVIDNKIPFESIIAHEYNSRSKKLYEISDRVRNQIK